MICSKCGGKLSCDSTTAKGEKVYRRRVCQSCHKLMVTCEKEMDYVKGLKILNSRFSSKKHQK